MSRQTWLGNSRTKCRSGLTMVELLAATLLTTLLMGALVGVLQSITRSQEALLADRSPQLWKQRLIAQFEWDLVNSRTWRLTPNGFELTGFAGRNFADGTANHQATVLTYEIIEADAQICLIRREAHTDSLNLDNELTELVAIGIERIQLAAEEDSAVEQGDAIESITQIAYAESPLPRQIQLALFAPDEPEPVLNHVFVLP